MFLVCIKAFARVLKSSISIFSLDVKMNFQTLVLLALSVILASADNANKVTFILDFLKSQTKPTNLIVWQNCFDERQKVKLIKDSFISTVFNKQDSLNESDFRENPQYCLFTLDLTCTKSPERIIQKVNRWFCHFHYWFWANLFVLHTDRHGALLSSIPMGNVCWRR